MSNVDLLLQVNPDELKFIFELKKQISCTMQLSNKSDKHVAFKVKTTKPKKYCVRPNHGVLLPHSTSDVIVTMQAQKDAPTDLECKDKFLIQSVVVSPGTAANDITQELFNKGSGKHVEEHKIRVSLVPPQRSKGDLLQFDPIELQFPFEVKKQISCTMQLSNKSDKHVAFKVKTTKPKKYCVKPNNGVLLPHSTSDVKVIMQAQKVAPTDLECKDKFMIQSIIVNPGTSANDITGELFNKGSGKHVEEHKFRVSLVPPQMSKGDLLQFDPIELQFPFERYRHISCSLKLSNKSNNHVAFKFLPTNPKNYTVMPNCGVIVPWSTCDVAVTLQAQKDAPTDLQCNDKLKIQSVVVCNQESGNHVEERELRVSYVLPPSPPSFVRKVSKESYTASVSDNFTANVSQFRPTNTMALNWRGKLISLLKKLKKLFGTSSTTGDNGKQGQLIKGFVEDVSDELESNEERMIREQRMDDVLAPLLTNR